MKTIGVFTYIRYTIYSIESGKINTPIKIILLDNGYIFFNCIIFKNNYKNVTS